MLWVPVVGAILLWVSPPACTARTVQQGHSKSDRNLAALREELDCPGFDSRQRQVIFRSRNTFQISSGAQWITGRPLSPGVKPTWRENDPLPQAGCGLK